MPRYLTKSRFALAVQYKTKLFYTGKALFSYPTSRLAYDTRSVTAV